MGVVDAAVIPAIRNPGASRRMTEGARLASIDVLRGTCLLGILVMNIQSFAMPHAAYMNPTAFGSLEGAEGVAWAIGRLLFDFKYLNLFSMLFGASLVLGGDATRPRRRLAWLVLFGLVHAYLVWYGDILFTYGVVGLVVLGARSWAPRRQLGAGLALVLVGPALSALFGVLMDDLPPSFVQSILKHLDDRAVALELAAYRSGWLAQLPIRASLAFESQTTGLFLETGWRAAGCMLLGMAAVRAGLSQASVPFRRIAAALASGLLLTTAGILVQIKTGFSPRSWPFAEALHELGAVPLAVGIGLAVVGLANRHGSSLPARVVGGLGRVAFTAYLMQSVVGTFVFSGWGLGAFGRWSRSALLVAPLVFWSAQAAMAWWWTARFRVGPLEALWRGLARGDFSLGRVAARNPRP